MAAKLKIKNWSPDDIMKWPVGEVTKAGSGDE